MVAVNHEHVDLQLSSGCSIATSNGLKGTPTQRKKIQKYGLLDLASNKIWQSKILFEFFGVLGMCF